MRLRGGGNIDDTMGAPPPVGGFFAVEQRDASQAGHRPAAAAAAVARYCCCCCPWTRDGALQRCDGDWNLALQLRENLQLLIHGRGIHWVLEECAAAEWHHACALPAASASSEAEEHRRGCARLRHLNGRRLGVSAAAVGATTGGLRRPEAEELRRGVQIVPSSQGPPRSI